MSNKRNIDLSKFTSKQGFIIKCPVGAQASPVGDLNGDGIVDIILSSKMVFWDATIPQPNPAYVVYGKNGTRDNIADLTNIETNEGFNITVSSDVIGNHDIGYTWNLGDFNGDNIDNFAIGSNSLSKIFIIYGKSYKDVGYKNIELTNLDKNQGITIHNTSAHMAKAGDFNADGLKDLLILDDHMAYIIYGKHGIQNDIILNNDDFDNAIAEDRGMAIKSHENYTFFVASYAYDINGDNIDDITISGYYGKYTGDKLALTTHIIYGFNSTTIETVQLADL